MLEKDIKALHVFSKEKNAFLEISGSGANQHLVAVKRNWLGRVWMWICAKLGCGNARLEKIAAFVTVLMNKSIPVEAHDGLTKFCAKMQKYNLRHANKLDPALGIITYMLAATAKQTHVVPQTEPMLPQPLPAEVVPQTQPSHPLTPTSALTLGLQTPQMIAEFEKLTNFPVQDFIKNDVLAKFEKEVFTKKMSGSLPEGIKCYVGFMSALNQIKGWIRFEWYVSQSSILDPKTNTALPFSGDINTKFSELYDPKTPMGEINERGQELLKKIVGIVLQNPHLSAEQVLSNATDWQKDVNSWWTETDKKVNALYELHKPFMEKSKDLQRKSGVAWPHNTALRAKIEKTGFVFRPTQMKRDRCVCACGVEVHGWQAWFNPEDFHDQSKHQRPAIKPQP